MFLHRNTLIVALFIMFAALLTLNWVVLFAGHGILLFFSLADAFFALAPKKISFLRSGTESVKLGQTQTQKLTLINNSKRKVSGSFRDCWPPSTKLQQDQFSFTLAAAESKDYLLQLCPQRRGTRHSAFLVIRTLGPLRLAGRQSSFPTSAKIQVLPAFNSRKHLPSKLLRLRELEGRSLLLVRGQGTEFDSLREYVAGDDVRAIDWRSSARLGQTLVRTWRPERDRRLVILLDSGRAGAMRFGDFPAFDDYIETALLLTALAQRAGDCVDLYALDTQIQARVRTGTEANAIHKMASALADVAPQLTFTNWQLATREIARNSRNPALIVILTHIGISNVSDGLLEFLQSCTKNQQVIVATPELPALLPNVAITVPNSHETYDPAAADAVFFAVAKARADLERKQIQKYLALFGATAITAAPAELPGRVADTYLELKARGKL